VGRQVQDLQVVAVRPRRLRLAQQVVRQAEPARGEEFVPVAVVGERPRLADQGVDHVPVVDVPPAAPPQPRQRLHQLLAVPHLQVFQVNPHFDPLADQAAVHRVHVVLHADHAAAVHRHGQAPARLQAPRRQRPQQRLLLGQAFTAAGVAPPADLGQKRLVRHPANKVPATPQQQRLPDGRLEVPVRRLHVAILVRLPRPDLLAHQPVVRQQPLVTVGEVAPLRQVVHRTAQAVAAVPRRHAAQLRQRVLQARAQALEALGETDGHRLPVRVRQHKVVHQVVERLPRQGHLQAVHVREVRRAQPAREVDLAEVHLLPRAAGGAPLLDAPLEGAHLPVVEPARIPLSQPRPQRLGLELRGALQLLAHFRPDLGERVHPRAPAARLAALTGKPLHVPIPPCRLPIDARLPRRRTEGQALRQQAHQPPHVHVRDLGHRKLLPCGNLHQAITPPSWGVLIVGARRSSCRSIGKYPVAPG